jgi:geranylgeranyl diphosphate synthase type II
MKIEDRLSQKKKAVDRELELILPEEDSPLFQAMRYAVLSGGKRFRPLLALSSGECFGVSQNVLLPFACALELIHNYSLIHDDLPSMDNDDFRRGKPSCHKAFGEDIALLAGDALLTLAFEVLVRAPVSADLQSQKEQLIIEIGHLAGVRGMIGGQLMDITLSPEELTEEIMHELILKKTGALILASVKTGALLGKAGKSEFKAIVQYGRNIGLAFQIRDDILDSEGEERKEKNLSPNYVNLFGNEVSEQRLKSFVGIARSVLEETSLECEELHSLASKLLK